MKYTIYAALREDINSGWVWISTPHLPQRSIVRIVNRQDNKEIYCEALQIDENFLRLYNEDTSTRIPIADVSSALVMNEWYRKQLGNLKTQEDCELSVTVTNDYCEKIKACHYHPQIVVRIATHLGILSVVLGVVSIALSVWGLIK